MKTVLISIISEQTIPNVLMIRELRGQYDELAFITTSQMEEKCVGDHVEMACGLDKGSVGRIVVEPDLLQRTSELLSENFSNENHYLVNITGGTKLMSVAVFEFFSKMSSEIFYVPIGKNRYRRVFPYDQVEERDIRCRLSLKAYLLAYGRYFSGENKLKRDASVSMQLLKDLNKVGFDQSRVFQIFHAQELPDREDRTYFSGGWFEEYCFHVIQQHFKGSDVWMNVEVLRDKDQVKNDNEYDVMFVYENALYAMECKARIWKHKPTGSPLKRHLDDCLYKLAGVTKNVGLRVNSYLLVLSDLDQFSVESKENLKMRTNLLGIKGVIAQSDFNGKSDWVKKIK
ncbi:DUF1887 family protein [Halosquirtibacter laminarini]|uniref:DUF1887 family protein n=1 Tax=Halosquirtibacter laminarini TaxID=3374600 RepID=A0AC61NIF7_9BACT|nr:DUF1887 family protein [Prolixibacteraceae bacterium]